MPTSEPENSIRINIPKKKKTVKNIRCQTYFQDGIFISGKY